MITIAGEGVTDKRGGWHGVICGPRLLRVVQKWWAHRGLLGGVARFVGLLV